MLYNSMDTSERNKEADRLDQYLQGIAKGNQKELGRLYEQTRSAVFGFALSILKNTQDAEDILQEVYVKIYTSAQAYKSKGKPMAWILTITRNHNQLQSSVLSQTVSSDQNSKDLAEKFNISEGKASLIQEIVQKDPTLSFDTLASLSVSEIGLLMDSRAIKTDHVKKTGEVSVKGYIGKEAAKAIAFNHAKVSANAVTDAEIEFDIENGTLVYELEFTVGNTEYEYDIHAVTGEIINFSKEYEESGSASLNRDEDDDDDRYERDHDKDDDWDEDDRYEDNRTKDKVTQTSSSANATYIGKTKAKEIAYAHAKVKASQVRESSTELEKENKKMVYEVEFETADGEYEYVIDAVSGKIIYYEYEPEDSRSTMSSSQENDRQNKDGQSIRKHDDDDDWDDDDRYDRDDDRYDRDDDRYERDDDDDDYDD